MSLSKKHLVLLVILSFMSKAYCRSNIQSIKHFYLANKNAFNKTAACLLCATLFYYVFINNRSHNTLQKKYLSYEGLFCKTNITFVNESVLYAVEKDTSKHMIIQNAANSSLSHGAGVAAAIDKKFSGFKNASEEYIKQNGSLDEQKSCIVKSGIDNIDIINTVGPSREVGFREKLINSQKNALQLIIDGKYENTYLVPVSISIYKPEAISEEKILLYNIMGILYALNASDDVKNLKNIYFCIFKEKEFQAFEQYFKDYCTNQTIDLKALYKKFEVTGE